MRGGLFRRTVSTYFLLTAVRPLTSFAPAQPMETRDNKGYWSDDIYSFYFSTTLSPFQCLAFVLHRNVTEFIFVLARAMLMWLYSTDCRFVNTLAFTTSNTSIEEAFDAIFLMCHMCLLVDLMPCYCNLNGSRLFCRVFLLVRMYSNDCCSVNTVVFKTNNTSIEEAFDVVLIDVSHVLFGQVLVLLLNFECRRFFVVFFHACLFSWCFTDTLL